MTFIVFEQDSTVNQTCNNSIATHNFVKQYAICKLIK